LTGARVGWAIEPRKPHAGGADTMTRVAGNTEPTAIAKVVGPPAVEEPTHARKLHAREPGDPGSWPWRGAMVRGGKPEGGSHR